MKQATNLNLVPGILKSTVGHLDEIAELCEALFGTGGAHQIKVDAIIAAAPKIRDQLVHLRREQRRLRTTK